MAKHTDVMEDLTQEYEHMLAEKIGACHGQGKESKNLLKAFKDHIRTDQMQRELKNVKLFNPPKTKRSCAWKCTAFVAIPLLLALLSAILLIPEVKKYIVDTIESTECLVDNNVFLAETGRPIFNCDICRDMTEVPKVHEISREEFVAKYAYYSKPVLVKQAIINWTAVDTFSFKYFQKLYKEADSKKLNASLSKDPKYLEMKKRDFVLQPGEEPLVLESEESEDQLACQFFPYKTEFLSLIDAFDMPDARAEFRPGEKPWYFGWSNCDPEIQKELRRHYERPYFLPEDSETVAVDWIFMGGLGRGAPMHLDSVARPSWQAQISGSKTWTLMPVPECEDVCQRMDVKVEQGDIIVVDTNQWYHSTYVHPGALSITIGSEYD